MTALFGKSWAAAATATAAAAPPPTPVAVAVEVVEPLAAVAAVPKRKVGFDAHRIAPTSSACAVVDSITFHVIPASGTVLAADTIGCSPRQTASHAKAAAGVTPGLPSYSTAGGCEFYSTGAWLAAVRVRRSRRRRLRAVRRRRTTSAPTAS